MEVEGLGPNMHFFGSEPLLGAVAEDDTLHPPVALPEPLADGADAIAVERARAAISLKVASKFMEPGVFKQVFLVRQVLEPQRRLMFQLLHFCFFSLGDGAVCR